MRSSARLAFHQPSCPYASHLPRSLSSPVFLFHSFYFPSFSSNALSLSVHLRFHRVWQLTASHLPLSLSPVVPYRVSRRPPPKAHLPRAGSHCISNLAQPPGTCCTDCTVLLFRLSNVTGRRRSPPSQLTEHRGAPLGH